MSVSTPDRHSKTLFLQQAASSQLVKNDLITFESFPALLEPDNRDVSQSMLDFRSNMNTLFDLMALCQLRSERMRGT